MIGIKGLKGLHGFVYDFADVDNKHQANERTKNQ
jgi:hypothetical protein